ncbi:MAG: 50S ribosomal protein L37e [ANME-2 cluster archaeon]|nr:50S ribosomal protein L37e [ANME-2 cluster archaeon]MCD4766911.1 50S ribosomal protein L37e [Methanosarcinales archaeon]MBC2700209.1 50S ribosomal protein L37e [ANME-2 cluster archaeon]MBC2707176.1 50S ribosomal protein L37e [ANME-2 cluster archaeon]MBC2747594.1 50S ribosomal protein L37e [ANME-2 cluster archaeon]
MSKGTPSMGKRQKRLHIKCRRCGRVSLNIHKKVCVACGFKKTTRMRSYKWQRKSGLNGD